MRASFIRTRFFNKALQNKYWRIMKLWIVCHEHQNAMKEIMSFSTS